MKKRILSLLLCAVLILTAVPAAGFAQEFNAYAVETQDREEDASTEDLSVNIASLKAFCDEIPEKIKWDEIYIDYSDFEYWYDLATQIFLSPEDFSQQYIDAVEKSLKKSFELLRYHALGVTLDKTQLTLDVGSSETVKATLDPENAEDTVTWRSSNSSVVKVSDGVVTALKYSDTPVTITATANGYSATCVVNVLNPLGGVTISDLSKTIYDTQAFYLTAKAYGKDASSAVTDSSITYTWRTSNSRIATVSESGYVSGVREGTATITVTASNGKVFYEAKCVVTVNEMIEITGFEVMTTVVDGYITLAVGETTDFKIKITPETASEKNIKWSSSDPDAVTVTGTSLDGAVAKASFKAVRPGESEITYVAQDGTGIHGSFKIRVLPLVSMLSLSETVKVIPLGTSGQRLTATVLPKNAGNQVLEWTSSDPSVCAVDNSGLLNPKKNGVCTITAKTTDTSNISVSCSIRVAPMAQYINLNKTSFNLHVGSSSTLTATVKTSEGTVYTDHVEWVSENTKVATVDANGKVTAKYPGEAKIRAMTLDGTELTAACVVTVTQPVTGVTLPSTKTMGVGKSETLTATIVPSYASNKTVTWTSSDSTVATVDSTGKVTAKSKVGTCVITVTTADGGFKAQCTVNVVVLTAGIVIDKTSATIKAGDTITLKATVSPTGATDKTVKWTSSNTAVATVSSSGVVTAVAGGKATITATASGGQKATCAVSVTQSAVGVTLNTNNVTLYISQKYTLKASLIPSTATDSNFAWTTTNASVAVVTSDGTVTAIGKGTATVTVTVGSVKTACTVTVVDKIPVSEVSVTSSISIKKGDSYALTAIIVPENASVKTLTWTSSNTAVATVSASGVVTAVSTGRAVITVKTSDGGCTATCNVTVTQSVTGVRLHLSNTTVAVGRTVTLIANVFPTDATIKNVNWHSSDTNVITVSGGVVTGVNPGTATITVSTIDGGYTATCTVTVYIGVSSVKLSNNNLTIPTGQTRTLSATVYPANATNRSVTWSSNNTSIADVTQTGQITVKKPGTAVITVTTNSGYIKATCNVTVVQLATQVKLDYTTVTLSVGKGKTLNATLKPSNVSNTSVKWTSSNPKIAKVSTSGKVSAVAPGRVTVKATSGDSAVYTTCSVTVVQPATSLKLSSSSMCVHIGKSAVLTATIKPDNASNKKVTWISSDESIATVDKDGVVKGIKAGTVTITATADNGKVRAACKVTVSKAVKSIKLDKTTVKLAVGKTTKLVPTISPSNAANKKVTWTSNNLDVATVDKNGNVTAKSNGYAEITAKTADGGFKAVCRVTVVTPVKSIKLNVKTKVLDIGESLNLKVTFNPSNASNKSIKWTSSNKKVAKVSSSGKVTGLKEGTATITAKSSDGGYKVTCQITVIRKVREISLSDYSYTLYLDKSYTLKATIIPSDATHKELVYTSSNEKIVRVSSKGKLTPVKVGTATITVKSKQDGTASECVVKVERAVKKITLSKSSIGLKTGESFTLKATLSPTNATNKKLKWSSSNKAVASVSSSGVVTATGGGKATITAQTSNGLVKKCTVTVTQSVSGVTMSKPTLSLYVGQVFTLKANVLPANATNKNVTWITSNASIATVSQAGIVSAVKAGTVSIIAKTKDGNFTAQCKLTVMQHPTSVKLSEPSMSLAKGSRTNVYATVLPSDTTDKNVTWSSSNNDVATVTSSGQIFGHAEGEAIITVSTVDGGCKATCVVTVYEPVTGITLNHTSASMFAGDKFILRADISPSDATNKIVNFVSSDSLVASVNSNGEVVAKKPGTCVITASADNGRVKAICTVTVQQSAQKVVLSENSLTIAKGKTMLLVATVLPTGAYNKNVTWTSSDINIVRVDENGYVTAIREGTATITVKTEDGGYTAECEVTVIS